jgi:hypothetical protein
MQPRTIIGINSASAASGDTYKAKKTACEARAKTMKFGAHFVKKNRWVKDCIASKLPGKAVGGRFPDIDRHPV